MLLLLQPSQATPFVLAVPVLGVCLFVCLFQISGRPCVLLVAEAYCLPSWAWTRYAVRVGICGKQELGRLIQIVGRFRIEYAGFMPIEREGWESEGRWAIFSHGGRELAHGRFPQLANLQLC